MTFRSRALLDLANGASCVRCGRRDGTVVACHYTGARRGSYGGGMSIKVHDWCTADLCRECHEEMDRISRDKKTKWEHSECFLHLIMLTLERRFDNRDVVLRTQAHLPEAQRLESLE